MSSINKKGQSLIEIILAFAIFILGVASIGTLVLDAGVATQQSIDQTKGLLFAKEGIEAVRSIKDDDFDNLIDGVHGIALSSNKWILSGSSDNQDNSTRTITISAVDADTKKIESTVSWISFGRHANSVTLTEYLTDWAETHGDGADLTVDTSSASLTATSTILTGVTIQNTGTSSIEIDKLTISWENGQLIEGIEIDSGISTTTLWAHTGVGSPSGKQSSGTELDINNYILTSGSGSQELNSIDFDGTMTSSDFILKFIMTDGSTRYAIADF